MDSSIPAAAFAERYQIILAIFCRIRMTSSEVIFSLQPKGNTVLLNILIDKSCCIVFKNCLCIVKQCLFFIRYMHICPFILRYHLSKCTLLLCECALCFCKHSFGIFIQDELCICRIDTAVCIHITRKTLSACIFA